MNLENFAIKDRIIKDVESFLIEYPLRKEKVIGIKDKIRPRILYTIGKEKIGDFDGGLITSEYWQPGGDSYKSSELIIFLNSKKDKIVEKIGGTTYINDPQEGLLFHLGATRCYQLCAPNHWGGLDSRARIKMSGFWRDEWLAINGNDADRILSLVGL